MRRVLSILLVLMVTLGLTIPFAASVAASDIEPLTGVVPVDFDPLVHPDVWIIPDPQFDVGIPADPTVPTPPVGVVSGWDIKNLSLSYDPIDDTMYVGVDTFGIAGDADGDGNPGGTSPWLAVRGGVDQPSLGGTECVAVCFDFLRDKVWDVTVGVSRSTDITGYGVFQFVGAVDPVTGVPLDPGASFGAALPAHKGLFSGDPSALKPDVEFSILNWSTLPGNTGNKFDFRVYAFMGSQQDDGIGEDSLDGSQNPQLSIVKTVDCNGDGQFNASETVVGSSDDPVWKVVVTNTGTTTVRQIVVTDTNGHNFGSPFDLAPGASTPNAAPFIYTTHITATTTNTASAQGLDQLGGIVGPVSSSATNNLTSRPHTTVQSISATPSSLPAGGADVTIKVVDLNDGDVPITGAYFEIYANGVLLGHMSPDGVPIASLATQEFTYTVPDVTIDTTFKVIGHGWAGNFDVSGPDETREIRLSPPSVPGFSSLSIGLLIAGLTGAAIFIIWQRRRNLQSSR